MSSLLPYTPYQSHRRGASSLSISSTAASPNGSHVQSPLEGEQFGEASRSNSSSSFGIDASIDAARREASSVNNALLTPSASALRRPQVGSTTNHGGSTPLAAPPPLRTASSLKAGSKGKESVNASHSNQPPSGRKTVSATLAVPTQSIPNNESRSSNPALASPTPSGSSLSPLPPLRPNGHSKRHSYSLSPSRSSLTPSSVPSQSHTRSMSNNPPSSLLGLPANVSTAQRLREGRDTPLSTTSSSSSPTNTPAGLSPNLGPNGHLPNPPNLSTLPSTSSVSQAFGTGRGTTYRPGFQPKGVYRVRTDDFFSCKTAAKEGNRKTKKAAVGKEEQIRGGPRSELEAQRLERRLEKLTVLHNESASSSVLVERTSANETSSSSSGFWLPETIRKQRRIAEEEKRLREEEMKIVLWEGDSSRKSCAICETSFSLTIRKHHCRLCGHLVCASPHLFMPPATMQSGPMSPMDETQIAELKCSGLVMGEGKESSESKIKDVPRWAEKAADSAPPMLNASSSVARTKDDAELTKRRGVRICKDCRGIIMHRQYMLDDGSLPAYIRLYEALISLQKEIEQSLPEFQEMVLGLQKQDAAAALGTNEDESNANQTRDSQSRARTALALQRDAAQARKQLLANFANYDSLAKRIRNLPITSASGNGGSAQKRVQDAIWTRANVFLQQNMFPLQSLPKHGMKKTAGEGSGSGSSTPTSSNQGEKSKRGGDSIGSVRSFSSLLASSERQHNAIERNGADEATLKEVRDDPESAKEQLMVLEQQLSLVRDYAASAQKARKFQDAKTLRGSAEDLQKEIDRLRRAGVSI